MNADRRKALSALQDSLKAKGMELESFLSSFAADVETIKEEVEALKDAEDEYKENMPESLQGSEKYSTAEEAISSLEEAVSSMEEKLGELGGVTDEDFFSDAFDHIESAKGQ